MADNYEYAEMLEIPVRTCTVTKKSKAKTAGRSKTKNATIKEKVVDKVNETLSEENGAEIAQPVATETPVNEPPVTATDAVGENPAVDREKTEIAVKETEIAETENKGDDARANSADDFEKTVTVTHKKKKRITLVGIETVAIVALVLFIVMTNLVMANSGINTLLKMMNGTYVSAPAENDSVYSVFKAVTPVSSDKMSVKDGVITVNKSGSIYSPCDGTVTAIEKTDGKLSVEITHSKNFKTVINGMDYVYGNVGDKVYSNFPVGYLDKNTVTVSLYDKGALITGYTVAGNNIVWAV